MSGSELEQGDSPRPRCSIHGAELSSSGECQTCSQLIPVTPPSEVTVFSDGDDDGYRAWIAKHRGGCVINIQKSLNPTDAHLHQATCGTINDKPARGEVFVRDYVKVCGLRRNGLDEWAIDTLGATVPECGLCF